MDPHNPHGHDVPHVLDDPRDDPAFTAWLDAQEAAVLTQGGVDTLRHTITPDRRPVCSSSSPAPRLASTTSGSAA